MFIKIINKIREKHYYSRTRLKKLRKDELLAIIRHDCHRIEKSVYNNIFELKRSYFYSKKNNVETILSIFKSKNWYSEDHPVIAWALEIINNFNNLESGFIGKYKKESPIFGIEKSIEFVELVKRRRSCRSWDAVENQPCNSELTELAYNMIEAARWSPNSGNRQAWKFLILTKPEEKVLLKGLKEKHCYTAPLLIFIGMDSRFYSPAYHLKDCLLIDAGAAIMQMVNIANMSGIGVCWNHLSEDLIRSRKQNKRTYTTLSKKLNIPEYIKPVAILSVGKAAFLPPVPYRLNVEELLI